MRFAFNGHYDAAYDVLDLLRGDGENEREADKQRAEHHNEEYIQVETGVDGPRTS